eukprot:TRINITY_DN7597_c0_g1_i4.p1 TRINITY_DN7597_c0_g1~~TRINITY_DN7597_c0_g1_i4.p1  ORF type:complete len:116 (-),score=31.68 TRINITY_DN7597_c0_g1_i4:521-868(-)
MPRTWQIVPPLLPPFLLSPPHLQKLSLKREPLTPSVIKVKKMKIPARLLPLKMGEEPVKKSNGVVEGVSFDQILDLDSLPDSNKAETDGLVGLPTPIIAFEESITQQNNTADLLS